MDYSVLQITKLNTIPLIFSSTKNLSYPMPPLVTSELVDDDGESFIKVRATLFIDSENESTPTIDSITETARIIEIIYSYDYSEDIPSSYDTWYVEIDCTSKEIEDIKNVVSFLRDVDPTTSRGTQTRVQPTQG